MGQIKIKSLPFREKRFLYRSGKIEPYYEVLDVYAQSRTHTDPELLHKIGAEFAPGEGGIFLGQPYISRIGKDRALKKGINRKPVFQIGFQSYIARLVEERSRTIGTGVIAARS